MSNTILEFHNVSKFYGTKKVFENFNLKIDAENITQPDRPTNIIALLGANGAGKTTFIKMLLGLQTPHSGYVRVRGCDPIVSTTRAYIGATPQELDFPDGLKSFEILEFVRSHYSNPLSIETMSEVFALHDLLQLKAAKLSGGQKRRLALALAFVGNASLILLDEPTTSLDVIARKAFWHYIQNSYGKTILLTTHDLSEIEKVANHLLFLNNGSIVFNGTVNEFKKQNSRSMKKVRFYSKNISLDEIKNFEFVQNASMMNDHVFIETYESDHCIRELVQKNIHFQNLHIEAVSLEESFLNVSKS